MNLFDLDFAIAKMDYKDIPQHLVRYIPVSGEAYDSFDEAIRNIVIENATFKWKQDGSIPAGSIVYIHEQHPSHQNYSYLLDIMYSFNVVHSTMGILDYDYARRSTVDINNYDFIKLIQEAAHRISATNATLTFVDSNDVLHYLSFSRKDLQIYSTEQLLQMLTKAPDEWDKNLYSGSDYIMNAMKSYALHKDTFSLTVSHISGGYGKMIADYYETLGLENNGDDCLIQCFLTFLEIKYDEKLVNTIRNEIYVQEGKLGLDEVTLLEEKYAICVDVYRDQRTIRFDHKRNTGKDVPLIHSFLEKIIQDDPVLIHGDGTSLYKILFKDNHYDIITKSYDAKDCHCPYTGLLIGYNKKLSKSQLAKELKKKHYYDQENLTDASDMDENQNVYYYFFDYETVFNAKTLEIIPYAVSVCKTDYNFTILETKFYLGIDVCEREFIHYLRQETPKEHEDEKEIKYLIGYNNSRFDNYILLKSALRYNLYVSVIRFSDNSIISMHVNRFRTRDLCRILIMPLDRACKSFKITNAKQTSLIKHEDFQFAYMEGRLKRYCNEKYSDLRKYSIADVESLCELYQKTKECINSLVGVDIEDHYTLAGMSYKAFNILNTYHLPVLNNNYEIHDTFVRRAIIGGRSQISLKKATNLVSIDCVSLYPYVMLNNHYPVGYPLQTSQYVSGKIGVYEVTIHSQHNIKYNIVPLRTKDKPLNWEYKDEIKCVLTNVDIECLILHKCHITVGSGIYWEESTNKLFDSYFKPIIQEKIKQDTLGKDKYNHALRECCKLLMNALSGKLAQRIYTRETSLCRNASDVDKFFSRTMKDTQRLVRFYNAYIAEGEVMKSPTMPCIYGVLIYAYARSYMYNSVISKVDTLYGTDTDSAFISQSDFKRLNKDLMGFEFGQFKVEHSEFDAILIAPKCYIFYNDKEVIKARFKGVKIGSDKLCDETVKGDMTPLELYNIYHSDKLETTGKNIYEELYRKKLARVIANNIDKRVIKNNTAIYLSNHTFIKEIKLKDNDVYMF